MSLEMLRFSDGDEHGGPVRVELDAGGLAQLIASSPRPSVFVARLADLRARLKHPDARGLVPPMKVQHGTTLSRSFVGPGPVALEGKYIDGARLPNIVRRFARTGGERHRGVYFLGVVPELFDDLLARSGATSAAAAPTDPEGWLARFTGESPAAQAVRRLARRAAMEPGFADMHVLILGPTGAGKELVARAIHELGRGARNGTWVPVNCGSLTPELFEAELFGVEPQTATGVAGRRGLWEKASDGNGTLFLNEIGELLPYQQSSILRALAEGRIRRVGGDREISVHARVIADTNRDLYAMMTEGTFREDLYYRLAHVVVRVPGLAERGEDVGRLAQTLWREEITGSPEARLSGEVLALLQSHAWPGGVRQLRGLLETLYFYVGDELDPRPAQLLEAWRARPDAPTFRATGLDASPDGDGPGPDDDGPGSGAAVPLRQFVAAFKNVRPVYQRFAGTLRRILERATREVAPLAIVQTRAKTVSSFAEKVLRTGPESSDPFAGIRDLCGARVIVHTEDQVRLTAALLHRYFEVDPAHSSGGERDPGSLRSGCAPVVEVVRLDRTRAEALTRQLGVEVAEEQLELWAEIEVQTVLEHAWLHVNHEIGHRLPVPVPERWRYDLDELAGVLKTVDRSFGRIRGAFQSYRTSYPAFLGRDELEREIDVLRQVLECENDPGVAVRLGKLAIARGDFDRAVEVLSAPAASGFQPALRDLGVALCQKDRERPESALFARGQGLLVQACAEPHRDPDAFCSLAGSWKRRGRIDEALACYRRAHEIDRADPYALGGILECELALNPEVDVVATLEPSIGAALQRCRDHIEAGVSLPWAWYDLGKFLLLRGEIEEGLEALRHAVDHSTADFMIRTSLESLERIAAAAGERWPGVEEGRALLARSIADPGERRDPA